MENIVDEKLPSDRNEPSAKKLEARKIIEEKIYPLLTERMKQVSIECKVIQFNMDDYHFPAEIMEFRNELMFILAEKGFPTWHDHGTNNVFISLRN